MSEKIIQQTFTLDEMNDAQRKLWQLNLDLSRAISLNPGSKAAELGSARMRKVHMALGSSDTEISEIIKSGPPQGSYARAFGPGKPPLEPRHHDRITRQLPDDDPDYGSTSLELKYRPVRRTVIKEGKDIGKEVLFLDSQNPHYVANIVRLVDTMQPASRPIHNETETFDEFYAGKSFLSVEEFNYSVEPEVSIAHRIDRTVPWYAEVGDLTIDDILQRLNSHLGFIASSVLPEANEYNSQTDKVA
jgi:hypothetical protein